MLHSNGVCLIYLNDPERIHSVGMSHHDHTPPPPPTLQNDTGELRACAVRVSIPDGKSGSQPRRCRYSVLMTRFPLEAGWRRGFYCVGESGTPWPRGAHAGFGCGKAFRGRVGGTEGIRATVYIESRACRRRRLCHGRIDHELGRGSRF